MDVSSHAELTPTGYFSTENGFLKRAGSGVPYIQANPNQTFQLVSWGITRVLGQSFGRARNTSLKDILKAPGDTLQYITIDKEAQGRQHL